MEMALAAHSVPMFLHPLAYGVGNLEVPYSVNARVLNKTPKTLKLEIKRDLPVSRSLIVILRVISQEWRSCTRDSTTHAQVSL